jgi:SAM-dependent methyltransferase
MIDQLTVLDHYGEDDLRARVNQALQQAGLGAGLVDWSDFAPLDQFHVRGLAATEELAADLRVEVGASVLDVGCGLGGPARFLAATYGCRVTGIDLSQHFVDIATMLTERAGLMGSVRYRQAGASRAPPAMWSTRRRSAIPSLPYTPSDLRHRPGEKTLLPRRQERTRRGEREAAKHNGHGLADQRTFRHVGTPSPV